MIKNSLKFLLCMTALCGFVMAGDAALSTETPKEKVAKKSGAEIKAQRVARAKKNVESIEKKLAAPGIKDDRKEKLNAALEKAKANLKALEERPEESFKSVTKDKKIEIVKNKIAKIEKQLKDMDDKKDTLTKELEKQNGRLKSLGGDTAAAAGAASPEAASTPAATV